MYIVLSFTSSPFPLEGRQEVLIIIQFSSVTQLCPTLLRPHGLQHSQASLSITNSWSLLKLLFIELVMPSNHLILCHPLLLPSIFPTSGSFQMGQLFASGGQSIGVPAHLQEIHPRSLDSRQGPRAKRAGSGHFWPTP